MFVLKEILTSLALMVSIIFSILYFVLVVRIIISWVGADPYNEITRIIYSVTDPLLMPFKALPLQVGMIDFSPILAFLVLAFLRSFILNTLYALAARIG